MRGEVLQEFHIELRAGRLEQTLRKHQDGLCENNGHDPGKINAQRHERGLPGVNLASNSPLCVLHGYFALCLGYRDNPGNHADQQKDHGDSVKKVDLGFNATARAEHIF